MIALAQVVAVFGAWPLIKRLSRRGGSGSDEAISELMTEQFADGVRLRPGPQCAAARAPSQPGCGRRVHVGADGGAALFFVAPMVVMLVIALQYGVLSGQSGPRSPTSRTSSATTCTARSH